MANHMKIVYIFLGFATIMIYNAFLIHRDSKLFESYEKSCVELSQSSTNCPSSK